MVKTSPAIFTDLSQTISPNAITAISEVPPPISIIILPLACIISSPIPIAAAIGSYMRNISFPFTLSQDSFTALISTSVIPEGIQTTILSEGEKKRLFKGGILLIKAFIICSEASKSAITPSLRGRIVFIRS